MKKNEKSQIRYDYIDRIKEWQEHQYDPGYFTGGNIPPVITHPGKPKLLGYFLIISSIAFAVIMIVVMKSIFQREHIIPLVLVVLFYSTFACLQLIGGLRLIRKNSTEESLERIKKISIILFCIIVISVIAVLLLNTLVFVKVGTIVDVNIANIKLSDNYNEHFIILEDRNLRLSCSSDYSFTIWAVKVTEGNAKFKIKYKWNILNPKTGNVLKIERIE